MNMDIVERLGRVCEDGADPDLIDAVVNLRTTPSAKGWRTGVRGVN